MSEPIQGSCLCRAVAFELSGPFEAFHWCHCSRCRKETGSAHAANIFARPDAIRWLRGQDKVKRFELPEAERFTRAFCLDCGAPMPYLNRSATLLVIPAGSLDADPGISPQDNIHWRSRASWYDAGLAAPRYDDDPPA